MHLKHLPVIHFLSIANTTESDAKATFSHKSTPSAYWPTDYRGKSGFYGEWIPAVQL